MTFELTSVAFRNMGAIPTLYTCEGKNISPQLSWKNLPKGTKSLVLIVDDPDAPDPAAPKFTWVHWVLYNIPPETTELAEGAGNQPAEAGMLEGFSSWNRGGYGGPCPPVGTHRYFFKLYALDTVIDDLLSPLKADVEAAMKGHILGEAMLIGTYKKEGN
ncbi:YbhB/YbcL family Raf kinase inhibitor-like protein [Chlorobaculum sp. MV4-Y]|uniref:YbhB/YbcL family Raf kinase inhibitor-like protein n=1 Tax=Chlorobaculum sp. MV4-Y TaxID=2976335 RepID=UPI003982F91F